MPDNPTPATNPRKPWLAGLLAIFFAGLGHLYVGRPLITLALWLASLLLLGVSAIAVVGGIPLFGMMVVLMVVAVAIWFTQVVSAVVIARREGTSYEIRPSNRLWVYAGYIVFVTLVDPGDLVRWTVVEAFKIPAGSMAPTLVAGDQVFATKIGVSTERGALIVFDSPVPPFDPYVKRVIAGAGDEVEVRGGVPIINGTPTAHASLGPGKIWDRGPSGRLEAHEVERYRETAGEHSWEVVEDADENGLNRASDYGPAVVPEGHLFVLGDNRDHSFDSRSWGFVPIENVSGNVDSVWWSWGPDGPRWERVGLELSGR